MDFTAGLINTALGMGLEGHNDRRQYFQQKRLQNLQIRGQKEMSEFNKAQAMDIWHKTNYEAQTEEMKKANLNVGMMYGGSGPGGTTQTAPGTVSGGSAAGQSGEIGMGLQLGLQTAMQEAQIELTKAQTEKTKVEAEKTAGVDTAEATQRTEHDKVKMRISQADERAASASVEARIKSANEEAAKMEGEAKSAKAKGEIDENTMNEQIDAIRLANIETQLEMAATKAGIKNTEQNTKNQQAAIKEMAARIQKMSREGAQEWQKLSQADRENWIKEQLLDLQRQGVEFQTGGAAQTKQWAEIVTHILTLGIGQMPAQAPRKIGF